MPLNKQQIRTALTHVLHPALGKDVVSLEMIRDLVVQDKFITFTIEMAEENPKIERKLKELCKKTIRRYVDKEAVMDIQSEVNPLKKKQVEKKGVEEIEGGANPMNMDPPSADDYVPPSTIDPVPYEEMPEILQRFMDEHEEYLEEIDRFEQALLRFKEEQWVMDEEMNEAFTRFFTFMDDDLLEHNREEERTLFPLLQERLMEAGEHSQFTDYVAGGEPRTAVEVMEDEHVTLIQLSSLAFNFLGLAPRLPDVRSQSMVSDLAFEQGCRLVEVFRLHIQRENRTLFPRACTLISDEEFKRMAG